MAGRLRRGVRSLGQDVRAAASTLSRWGNVGETVDLVGTTGRFLLGGPASAAPASPKPAPAPREPHDRVDSAQRDPGIRREGLLQEIARQGARLERGVNVDQGWVHLGLDWAVALSAAEQLRLAVEIAQMLLADPDADLEPILLWWQSVAENAGSDVDR